MTRLVSASLAIALAIGCNDNDDPLFGISPDEPSGVGGHPAGRGGGAADDGSPTMLTGGHGGTSTAGHGGTSTEGEGGTNGVEKRRICDGSTDIRFAFYYDGQVAREFPFTATLYDLGLAFFYVDGQCHYWAQEPEQWEYISDRNREWRGYREGTLTAAQESRLHDEVGYDDFMALGPRCDPEPGTSDNPAIFTWDGNKLTMCTGIPIAPVGWPVIRRELFEDGTPVGGAVRIEVGLGGPIPPGTKTYTWPLTTPPDTYSIDYSDSMALGMSTLITAPKDVSALRALRTQVIADSADEMSFFNNSIVVDEQGHVLAIRDDVPFTSPADGLWHPPKK